MNRSSAILKLANTFHLNVTERAQFITKPVSIVELAEAIQTSVLAYGCYPQGWESSTPYEGIRVCANDSGYIATKKAEVSLFNVQVVEEKRFSSAVLAAKYVAKHMFPSGIDGVPCQW